MKERDPERILEVMGKLKGCLLIVEGRKDAKSLNTLGLTNILAINGKPLISVVEKVAEMLGEGPASPRDSCSGKERGGFAGRHSDIIILTDFDQEGRRLAGRLSRLLRAHKVHPNQRLRSRIMNLGFNKIEDIKLDSVMRAGRSRRSPGRKQSY